MAASVGIPNDDYPPEWAIRVVDKEPKPVPEELAPAAAVDTDAHGPTSIAATTPRPTEQGASSAVVPVALARQPSAALASSPEAIRTQVVASNINININKVGFMSPLLRREVRKGQRFFFGFSRAALSVTFLGTAAESHSLLHLQANAGKVFCIVVPSLAELDRIVQYGIVLLLRKAKHVRG